MIEKLEALEVEKYLTDYQPKYLQNAFFVYIATDDRELNNQIIRDADELEYCVLVLLQVWHL